jgi:hypothetical protein
MTMPLLLFYGYKKYTYGFFYKISKTNCALFGAASLPLAQALAFG